MDELVAVIKDNVHVGLGGVLALFIYKDNVASMKTWERFAYCAASIFFGVFVKLFISAHFLACAWHFLARIDEHNSWLFKSRLNEASIFEKYLSSVYFIFGYITHLSNHTDSLGPVNNRERLFCIFLCPFSILFSLYTLSKVPLAIRRVESNESFG